MGTFGRSLRKIEETPPLNRYSMITAFLSNEWIAGRRFNQTRLSGKICNW